MIDPTVELVEQDERDWQAERQEEIADICWQKCEGCGGKGFNVMHLEDDKGGPEYILTECCAGCNGQGHIQIHDPQHVEALYAAADEARRCMGVWLYTRIAKALALAIEDAVWPDFKTVKSASVKDRIYRIDECIDGCNCYDAHYRAPRIKDIPHCKHQIAVWLVKAAEKRIAEEEQFIREEKAYE